MALDFDDGYVGAADERTVRNLVRRAADDAPCLRQIRATVAAPNAADPARQGDPAQAVSVASFGTDEPT